MFLCVLGQIWKLVFSGWLRIQNPLQVPRGHRGPRAAPDAGRVRAARAAGLVRRAEEEEGAHEAHLPAVPATGDGVSRHVGEWECSRCSEGC